MVSTRQMATSSNGGNGGGSAGGSNNNIANGNGNEFESGVVARQSVVTRQASSKYFLLNCPTIASVSGSTAASPPVQSNSFTQHAIVGGATVSSGGASTSMITRHHACNMATDGVSNNIVVAGTRTNATPINLQDLPQEILALIFSFLAYKKVGQLRLVSPKMNDVCMFILNSTFSKLITQTYNRFHQIKNNMPRRESARRNHPLSCECDIIETCNMRLSLLQMTFGKRIERGHCCFFPGAILDEVYTILNYIKNTPRLERPYRVTDELFDLSTMAMEYFRDHIEPTLPDMAYFNKDFYGLPTIKKRPALLCASDHSDNSSSMPSPPQSNMVLRKGIRKIKQGMKIYNNQLSVLRSELRTCKRKSSEQGKQLAEHQKLMAEQQKQTLEYASRLDENDKKYDEMAHKFSTLLQELNKCKTELQYWRSKSPAIQACTSCGQKAAPVLPPEDYQALINQGVKPEDIILNLNEDTDTESDASMNGCDNRNVSLSGEFVSPDEATTAKLLAVNTATKNLKRQHSSTTTTTTTTSNSNTSKSNGNNGNSSSKIAMLSGGSGGGCGGDGGSAFATAADEYINNIHYSGNNVNVIDKPSEMTNCLNYAGRIGNIIKCTTISNVAKNNQEGGNSSSHSISNGNVKDLNNASVIGQCNIKGQSASINNVGSGGVTVDGVVAAPSGYSTKLFYGTATDGHKGVIVSPLMLTQKSMETTAQYNAAVGVKVNVNDYFVNADAGGGGAGGGVGSGFAAVATATANTADKPVAEDVAVATVSHETKKARRVQKATRCLNGSGKRSK